MYYPGTVLLWAAFLLGAFSTVAYGMAIRGSEQWQRMARQAYVLMTAAVVVASTLLLVLLLRHDYRLFYVYSYSDNALPLHFVISSFWAGQEGSFLLWILCGALLGLPLMRFARVYETRVMLVYNLTVLSLITLLLKQSPFRFHQGLTASLIPADGAGLNPLLQNPWMVIHPPVMFVGYASLAIPFSFALAALWMRRYDEWTGVSLPWVLLSLGTLGLAIMMGGYWAYETLGWGGYWGWDPVENASLVPWLATAALAHGMLLQRTRQRFRRLNLFLAISAHLLVVYATFLTRSGVLSDFSVHSFVDLGISGWLVVDMLFFLVLGLGTLAWRWRDIPTEVGKEPFLSRTVFTVLGILLVILIGVIVLLGTSTPLISRLWGEPSQVGPEFYNRMGYWLAVAFSVVLGASPFLAWGRAGDGVSRRLLGVLGGTAALLLIGSLWLVPAQGWGRDLDSRQVVMALVYCGAALFAALANMTAVVERWRRSRLRAAGGAVAHVGLAVMVLAFMTTGWLGSEEKVRLEVGSTTEVLGYSMSFVGRDKPQPTARDAMVVQVTEDGGEPYELRPLMWINAKTNQMVANPDIKSSLTGDLYLAPASYDPGPGPQVSSVLTLTRDQPGTFRDWSLVLRDFELAQERPDVISVGMVVELARPDAEPVELVPVLSMTADGRTEATPVEIPGTAGGLLRATGMNVDAGVVRVELLGLGGGVGRTALLRKDETLSYKDLAITFADFDLEGFDPEAGKIDFGVVFEVARGETSTTVVPRFATHDGHQSVTPAEIPGSNGLSLSLGRIDAEGGAVELQVLDPWAEAAATDPPELMLDVSTKPLVGLIWLGTILVVAGVAMAMLRRGRDVAALSEG
jgi:cytochrome c-type biogenesis protein CcmF